MDITAIDPRNPDPAVIAQAADCIRRGFVVMMPTDTVYGLAANALDEKAVRRVFAVKGRPPSKAVPLLVKNIAMARRLAYISDAVAERLKALWPGAVTVVLHKKDLVPAVAAGGGETIGLRISAYPVAEALVAAADVPLTGTSANVSDMPGGGDVAPILEQFKAAGAMPDLVLDAGTLPPAQPSTVVDLTRGEPHLLRMGPVTKRDLERLWRDKNQAD